MASATSSKTKPKLKEKTLVRFKPVIRSTPSELISSEFNWPTASTGSEKKSQGKDAVKGLISALKGIPSSTVQSKLSQLKKHLSTTYDHHSSALRAPLPDRERERFERDAAYRQTSEQVGNWDEIVKGNRLAEKLEFPLYSAPLRLHTVEEKIDQFQPRTKLEIETANILANSKHNLRNSDPLTEAEKEALKSLSLEEARERRSKLQKMRALVSYAERKLRWQNRIKSKRYRRLLKRHDRKKMEKEFQELLDRDPAAALDKLEMLERDRIKERASLKHRSTGKWAKQVRHLSKKDPRLREALQEQLRKGRELAEKKKAEVNVESEESEDEEIAENGEDTKTESSENVKKVHPMLDTTSQLITNLPPADEQDSDDGQGNNQALMAEAFADDDIVEEFREELAADIDKEHKEAIDSVEAQLTLPGWNSWTGQGTENLKANRKRRAELEAVKKTQEQEKRKRMNKWPNVIINEEANESVKKMQVSNLPFPFCSTRDFEANLEPPLGKEWNPETVHQSLIQPSVKTRMGAVIKPMDKNVALKKKTEEKTKQRRPRKRSEGKGAKETKEKSKKPGNRTPKNAGKQKSKNHGKQKSKPGKQLSTKLEKQKSRKTGSGKLTCPDE